MIVNCFTMSMSQAEHNPLIPQDHFPRCVSMKLHSESIQARASSFGFIASTPDQVNLKLTIRFGKEEIPVPNEQGRLQFGLKCGTLKLRLENGKIPLEEIGLARKFEREVEVEEQKETSQEEEVNLSMAGGVKTRGSNKSSLKNKKKFYQVDLIDPNESMPSWKFETQPNEPVLLGVIQKESLGIVKFDTSPCKIEALFEIKGQVDLLIDWGELKGLSRLKNMVRDKEALFNILIFQKLKQNNYFQFCLSEVRGYL
jgi:hypothetical protein